MSALSSAACQAAKQPMCCLKCHCVHLHTHPRPGPQAEQPPRIKHTHAPLPAHTHAHTYVFPLQTHVGITVTDCKHAAFISPQRLIGNLPAVVAALPTAGFG